jgi:hypothetical protein
MVMIQKKCSGSATTPMSYLLPQLTEKVVGKD